MKQFLSPEVLQKALKLLRVEEGGGGLVLAGGLAMQLYGSNRLTGDLDLLAGEVPAMVTKFAKRSKKLSFGGVRFKVNGVPVDILVRSDDLQYLYGEALRDALQNGSEFLGVRVVSMEYLAVMKMAAGRDKDMLDLSFLLVHPKFKYKTARGLAVMYLGWYAGKELDNFRMEAKWKKDAGLLE